MEIIEETTIGEISNRILALGKSSDTRVKVIIQEIPLRSNQIETQEKKSKFLFLNDDIWEGKNTPTDLAENHDDYLYGIDE